MKSQEIEEVKKRSNSSLNEDEDDFDNNKF